MMKVANPEQHGQVQTPEKRAEKAFEAIESLLGEMSPTEHGAFLSRMNVLAKSANEKDRIYGAGYFDALMFYVIGHLKKLLDEADDPEHREHWQRNLGTIGVEHAQSFIEVFARRLGMTPLIKPTSSSSTIAPDEQTQFFARLQALCDERCQQLEKARKQPLEPPRRTIEEKIRRIFSRS